MCSQTSCAHFISCSLHVCMLRVCMHAYSGIWLWEAWTLRETEGMAGTVPALAVLHIVPPLFMLPLLSHPVFWGLQYNSCPLLASLG